MFDAPDKSGKVEVQAGIIKTKVAITDLELIVEEKPATETGSGLSEEERKFIEWYRSQASDKDKALVRMIVEGDR